MTRPDPQAFAAWNRANLRARLAYYRHPNQPGENPQRKCATPHCGNRTRRGTCRDCERNDG